MSTTACHCSHEKALRTVKHSVGWFLPGVMLALLPKCPLCLAAWLSLALGIGLSTSAAAALHATLFALCVLSCLLFLIRHICLLRHSRNT